VARTEGELILLKTVLLKRDHQIATIIFNRPEKMNAFNKEMANQLEDVVDQVRSDPVIRAVVIKGAGEVFMAGSDIQEFNQELDYITAEALSVTRHFNSSIIALREMEKPVLAVVHGLVIGTGISFMLAADLVLASSTTQFSLGFNRIATTPAGGVSYSLPRLVGSKKAAELLLFSDTFDADAALNFGLINWVVPQDELESRAQSIIDRLVNGPTLAYSQTKQLLNSAWQNKVSTQLELEAESFLRSVNSKDFKTAVRAFVNKREPEFEGR